MLFFLFLYSLSRCCDFRWRRKSGSVYRQWRLTATSFLPPFFPLSSPFFLPPCPPTGTRPLLVQMKQLELQQQMEEQALLAAQGGKPGGPVRSRSGNDLASFNSQSAKYAAAKSMPGSRRHSGELSDSVSKEDGAAPTADGVRRVPGANGQQRDAEGKNQLNSFLFDDELDADLQNSAWGGKYLQMNTDDDKFPILVRHGGGAGVLSASSAALDLAPLSSNPQHAGEWPAFAAGVQQPIVSSGAPSTPATPSAGASPGGRSLPLPGKERSSPPGSKLNGTSSGPIGGGSSAVDALGDQFGNVRFSPSLLSLSSPY